MRGNRPVEARNLTWLSGDEVLWGARVTRSAAWASDYRRRRNGISEMRSATRMRQLRHVLPPSPKSLLHENIARLAVLYEDLRIELTAASASSIRKLDRVDSRYRRNYFLRKCIGTIVEFAEAIRLLDGSPEFKVIKSNFSTDILKYWTEGVKFFRKHERFLKSVRNDIGGHFGTNAAKYAVLNLDTETIGKIELIDIGGPKARIHLYFAGEIAAVASLQHLVKGRTPSQKFANLLRLLVVSFRIRPDAYTPLLLAICGNASVAKTVHAKLLIDCSYRSAPHSGWGTFAVARLLPR